jgi:hypothetical protein
MSTGINLRKRIAILDEGSSITSDADQINFTGTGITATASGNNVTVNVTGPGITVGTTAVTSGTNGRVFFQAGGVVQQDTNFTYDNTLKRLGLRAVGTAATDIPLAIRNSADTFNLFNVNGLGRARFSFDATNTDFISIEPQQSEISMLSYGGLKMMSMSNSQSFFGFGVASYRMGIGNNSPQARLDVRAQGALSTDIAFRVRNSADNSNILTVNGDGTQTWFRPANNALSTIKSDTYNLIQWSNENFGNIAIGYSISNLFTPTNYYNTLIGASNVIDSSTGGAVRVGALGNTAGMYAINIGYAGRVNGTNTTKIGFHTGASSFGGTNSIHIGTTTSNNDILADNVFMTYFNSQSSSTLTRANGSFGLLGQGAYILANGTGIYGIDTFMGNGGNTLVVRNHTSVPSTNITDSFQQYSADIVTGNAAPHFRTENGDVIKLYKQSSAGIATVGDLVTILTNLGLLG